MYFDGLSWCENHAPTTHIADAAGNSHARLLWYAIALVIVACQSDAGHGNSEAAAGPAEQVGMPTLVLELHIGAEGTASSEYQFSMIRDVIVTREGSMWVLDGHSGLGAVSPLLRRYDRNGKFLGAVGGAGSGPGEFRDPGELALLPDGRVALRDMATPGRITFYRSDGAIDTTWILGSIRYVGASPLIGVDTTGILWLSFREGRGPSWIQPTAYARVRNSEIIDIVDMPIVPDIGMQPLRATRILPNGRTNVIGFAIPYEPHGVWRWSPTGAFAVARSDRYRIELVPPAGTTPTAPSRVFTRLEAPVPVPHAERIARLERLMQQIASAGVESEIRLREIPSTKPYIRYIDFSADGQVLVAVFMPSIYKNGGWTERRAFDVFAPDGRFKGRLEFPDDFYDLAYMRGDLVWTVFRSEDDVESIRRYRIYWASGG